MSVGNRLLKTEMNKYKSEYKAYAAYADFLKTVLAGACKRIAPFAIVDARPKSKASYAEKIVRKQEKFKDPSYQITDRCGARVITQTSQEKALMCDYIRRNFDLDEKNSLDVRSRLKEDEFGYLSVHYVVQIKKSDKQLEGIPVPRDVKTGSRGFKAEIQIRTLLEHTWANILHDRLYKVALKVPALLKRDAHALAATMEDADARFSRLSQSIDAYLGNYSAYLPGAEMVREVEILKSARQYEDSPSSRAALTLRLARLARISGRLDQAIGELESCVNDPTPSRDALCMELGHALCLKHRADTLSAGFARGQKLLQAVVDRQANERDTLLPADLVMRAEASRLLAWSFGEMKGRESEARDCYRRAIELDPENPYHLAAFLEYEAFCRRDHSFIRVMRAAVEHAIATCRAHVAVGIELPRAHFTIGRLFLLVGDQAAALNAYARAVRVTLAPGSTAPETVFEDEIDFLCRINTGNPLPAEHKQAQCLLKLARVLKAAGPDRPVDLKELAGPGAGIIRKENRKSALIVVGGAARMSAAEAREYAPIVKTALQNCDGLVFCGGTKAGIPGLVGEIASGLKGAGRKKFFLMGYISGHLPADAPRDDRYDILAKTGGGKLTEMEPLQNWIDLIQAGIRPDKVRVLGINGGPIAGFEYRLALALGARLGVVLCSGRAANALLRDDDWADDPNLVRLPREILEPATLRAFVCRGDFAIPPHDLDKLGEMVHEDYLIQNQYSDVDPVRKSWDKLREDFKESNREQVSYAAEIMRTEGYSVKKAKGRISLPKFTDKEIERMAVLEHGRWVIERLSCGWTWGLKKEPDKKISPYLCAWEKVPDYIRDFDRNAIRNYARILAKAGYRVVRR
ncbi:MAG: RyR domain-containing protein [Kiritimatiellia bacterium]